MTLNESSLLDARAAAAKLNVSLKTLYNLRMAGKIPTVRLSERRVAFDPSDLTRFVESSKQTQTPATAVL